MLGTLPRGPACSRFPLVYRNLNMVAQEAVPIADETEPRYREHEVIKSKHDKKFYKYVTLKNKLKILLVSDESTEKASAALDVHVGTLSDPDNVPGLAHFCEHMLFLGTRKYPKENDFTQYLSEHGGRSNAFTSLDHTNYHFDVRQEAFAGALDRFAQFFLCPLFDPDSKDREVIAIDSEHQKNVTSDSFRIHRIDHLTSKEGHVLGRFGSGNLNTLKTIPEKENIDIRNELLKFHDSFYSANIMTLVVIGKESISELEQLAIPLFENVINLDVKLPCYEQPYGEKELGVLTNVVTMKEMRELSLSFPLPDLSDFYEYKPGGYVSHLIGHEGEGSLLSILKKTGWVISLQAGAFDVVKGIGTFSIIMELSEEGLEHVDEIIHVSFQYIELLKHEDPKDWVYNELKMLGEMEFQFKDVNQPIFQALQLAGNMHRFQPQDVLCGWYVLRKFRPDLIKMVLECLSPAKMRCSIASQAFVDQANLCEEYYGIKYGVKKVDNEKIERWSAVGLHPDLKLPEPNPFIPESLEVIIPRTNCEKKDVPRLIKDTQMMRIWYKMDDTFFLPKSCIRLCISSPLSYTTPLHFISQSLFMVLVKDALAEFTYDAEIAGIRFNIEAAETGVTIDISGYNDKQLVLLEKILRKMTCLEIKEERFKVLKEQIRLLLANYQVQQPYVIVDQLLTSVTREMFWTAEDQLAAVADLTVDGLNNYIPEFLRNIYIEALFTGNLLQSDAERIVEVVEKIFVHENKSKPMYLLHHMKSRQFHFPDGCSYLFEQRNLVHQMSCVEVYLQFGQQETTSNVLSELLSQCLREPCFDTLRTKEQLGYVVASGLTRSRSAQGLRLLIQSDQAPGFVEGRIDAFLDCFEETLKTMSDEEFGNHIAALATKKLEKPKNLVQETANFWAEITCGHYHFDRANVEVHALKKLTMNDVLDFYKMLVSPKSASKRKLTVVVLGKDADSVLKSGNEEKQRTVIEDVLRYKSSLPLFPLPMPFIDIPIVQQEKSREV